MIILRKSIIEQRQFGIIANLRRKYAKKYAEKSSKELVNRLIDWNSKKENIKPIIDKELRNSIYKNEMPKVNSTHLVGGRNLLPTNSEGKFLKVKNAENLLQKPFYNKREMKFLKKMVKKKKNGVVLPKNSGIESDAHELGHSFNAKSKGLDGIISRLDPRAPKSGNTPPKNILSAYPSPKNEGDKKVGIFEALKDHFNNYKNSKLILKEEENASKKALDILKRNGATEEQLIHAKENLDHSLESYKIGSDMATKSSWARVLRPAKDRGTIANGIL